MYICLYITRLQRLTVEAPEEQMDAIMDEAVKRCKKIEPDCTIVR